MAGEKHLYLVAGGGYTTTPLAMQAEEWQFGIRLLTGGGGEPDPIGSIANNWDVVAANIDRNETNWTISGNWTIEGGVNDLDPGNYLNNQAAPAVAAFIETAGMISSAVQLRTLKLYPIGAPDGRVVPAPPYLQGSPVTLTWKTPNPAGAQSGALLPPESSVVVSLRTSQIGRRGRGRFYPPPSAVGAMGSAADGGTIASTTRTAWATAAKQLLEDLQMSTIADGFDVRPIVTGAPFTEYALINQVRIGSLMDSQRRRKKTITEVYTTTSVVNPT